jgi:hypothetical protein
LIRRPKIADPPQKKRYEKKNERQNKNKDIKSPQFQLMYEKMKQSKNVAEASKLEVNGKIYSRTTWVKVLKSKGQIIPKKKGKKSVWTDQQVDTICDYIGKNNNLTISDILNYAVNVLHYPSITLPTLERYLNLKLITRKQTVMHPFSRNSPQTKERRKEYATWLSKKFAQENYLCRWFVTSHFKFSF